MTTTAVLRQIGTRVLGARAVGRAARRIAAARGCSLVLVYHRVTPEGPTPPDVVPCISQALFRQQVGALRELGELVPLEHLVGRRGGGHKVRFALTFDDDYATHASAVLPVLRELQAHGTFFLSGRSLHGLGPYWFEVLEQVLRMRSPVDVARSLGLSADTAEQLALACERNPRSQCLLEQAPKAPPAHLLAGQIAALSASSMTIGFHTLHHRVLTTLPGDAVNQALGEGRLELANAAGKPLQLFSYPHGKGDRRVAAHVRASGYRAAWTGVPNAMRPGADPFLLGRWEPGPLMIDQFIVKVAVRLNRMRPATPS